MGFSVICLDRVVDCFLIKFFTVPRSRTFVGLEVLAKKAIEFIINCQKRQLVIPKIK